MKKELPNSTAILVLGILSIVFASCYGIPGLVLGIIGLSMSKKASQIYQANPEEYSGHGNMQAGRVMSIIGLSISGLFLLFLLAYLVIYGTLIISMLSLGAQGA